MLERLSWKRLVFELILCCIPAFLLGAFLGHLPWFLLASVTGLLLSYHVEWPTSPAIVLCLGATYLGSLVLGRQGLWRGGSRAARRHLQR